MAFWIAAAGIYWPGNSSSARLEGANLRDAHLEGAILIRARGLSEAQLAEAFGDAATLLPEGIERPARWPAADAGPASPSVVTA